MSKYEETLAILESLGWLPGEFPDADQVALALDTETPEEVAAKLQAYLVAKSDGTPPYFAEMEPHLTIVRRKTFAGHFRRMYAAIALGQSPDELHVDTIGEAKTVDAWVERLLLCRNRLGEHAGDQDEYDRRFAAGRVVPEEWQISEETARLYQLLVWEGYNLPPVASVRGLSRQEHLDNLRCTDRGWPLAWSVKRPSSKVPQ